MSATFRRLTNRLLPGRTASTEADTDATYSIDSTFQGSPVAVSWPKVFTSARLTEVRQRKNSRSQSTTLPGETRDEIRAHIAMQTIGEDDNAVSDDH